MAEKPPDSKENPKELRILLLGKTGSGKSSTANAILGKEEFETGTSTDSVTKRCQFGTRMYGGRKVVVVDTPGFFDTSGVNARKEIIRALALMSPGMHAILYVTKPDKMTPENIKAIERFMSLFKENVGEFTFLTITNWDRKTQKDAPNRSVEGYVQSLNIQKLSELVGKNYVTFDHNFDPGTQEIESAVAQLISKIDEKLSNLKAEYFHSARFSIPEWLYYKGKTMKLQYMKKLRALEKLMEAKVRRREELEAAVANLLMVEDPDTEMTTDDVGSSTSIEAREHAEYVAIKTHTDTIGAYVDHDEIRRELLNNESRLFRVLLTYYSKMLELERLI